VFASCGRHRALVAFAVEDPAYSWLSSQSSPTNGAGLPLAERPDCATLLSIKPCRGRRKLRFRRKQPVFQPLTRRLSLCPSPLLCTSRSSA
jgi:hypothetical protein